MTADSASPAVIIEGRGTRLWTLKMNRPHSRNAVDEEMQIALLEATEQLFGDEQVRAAVLTGVGPAFSAGGDVKLIRQMQADVEVRRSVLERSNALFRKLAFGDIPLVCAVNGPAVGAGCTLALCGDVIVMAEDAYLSEPRVALGLVPGDGGSLLWPLRAGMGPARAYVLTGERLPALDTRRIGIAHQVVAPSDLLPQAHKLAESLSNLPKESAWAMKRLMNRFMTGAEDLLATAMETEASLMDSADHQNAIDRLFGRAEGR